MTALPPVKKPQSPIRQADWWAQSQLGTMEKRNVLPLPKIELRIPVRLTRSLVTRLSLRLIACDVTHLTLCSFVASSVT